MQEKADKQPNKARHTNNKSNKAKENQDEKNKGEQARPRNMEYTHANNTT